MSDTKVQKIVIDYIKDKEKLKISWKIDNKRKQKVTIDYYKDLEKHINVLEQVLNQLNWKLVIKGDFFTDCEYDSSTGYQHQQELVELQISWSKVLSDITRTYPVKDFSIPLVLMDLKKLLDKDIEIKAEFN